MVLLALKMRKSYKNLSVFVGIIYLFKCFKIYFGGNWIKNELNLTKWHMIYVHDSLGHFTSPCLNYYFTSDPKNKMLPVTYATSHRISQQVVW